MTTYIFDAEDGVDGAAVTNADTPGLTWAGSTQPVYDAPGRGGGLAYRMAATSGGTSMLRVGVGVFAGRNQSTRFYFDLASPPTETTTLVESRPTSGSSAALIYEASTNALAVTDDTGAIIQRSGALPTDVAWIRGEFGVGAGTTTTNGIIRAAWGAEDEPATWSYATATANAGTLDLAEMRYGKPNSAGGVTILVDEITATDETNALLGPSNALPVAVVGPDQSVEPGVVVTLDGSASYDPDGVLGYSWAQTGGVEPVALTDAATATATFVAPMNLGDEAYTFVLTVTDDDGAQHTDSTQVMVLAVTERIYIDGVEIPALRYVVE